MPLSAHEQLTAIALAQDLLSHVNKHALVFLPKPVIEKNDIILITQHENAITAVLHDESPVPLGISIKSIPTEKQPTNKFLFINSHYKGITHPDYNVCTTPLAGDYTQADLCLLLTVLYGQKHFIPSQIGLVDIHPRSKKDPWHSASLCVFGTTFKKQNAMSWDVLRPLLRARLPIGFVATPKRNISNKPSR